MFSNKEKTVSALITLMTPLIVWAFYTIHNLELEVVKLQAANKSLVYQDNMYNALFQELYEYHGDSRGRWLGSMKRSMPSVPVGDIHKRKSTVLSTD